jgi:RimJ/RimL family protein N-acetyltransferase
MAPTFETDRLRLRAHTLADFSSCCELWSNADVARYTVGRPSTQEEVWSRILRYAGHWSLLGFGYWLIEERETGRFVGEAGFADYHREIASPLAALPDLGWVLSPSAHGRGYATEAANAALGWASEHLSDRAEVSCIIHPDNAASLRVAEKTGFQWRETATYRNEPTLILTRRLSPQAQGASDQGQTGQLPEKQRQLQKQNADSLRE